MNFKKKALTFIVAMTHSCTCDYYRRQFMYSAWSLSRSRHTHAHTSYHNFIITHREMKTNGNKYMYVCALCARALELSHKLK